MDDGSELAAEQGYTGSAAVQNGVFEHSSFWRAATEREASKEHSGQPFLSSQLFTQSQRCVILRQVGGGGPGGVGTPPPPPVKSPPENMTE